MHKLGAGTMMASSAGDIPTELAAMLGRESVQIRKTNDQPPQISVIDVVVAITGQNQSNAALALKRLQCDHSEIVDSKAEGNESPP